MKTSESLMLTKGTILPVLKGSFFELDCETQGTTLYKRWYDHCAHSDSIKRQCNSGMPLNYHSSTDSFSLVLGGSNLLLAYTHNRDMILRSVEYFEPISK